MSNDYYIPEFDDAYDLMQDYTDDDEEQEFEEGEDYDE
jgi:hypothetical protein